LQALLPMLPFKLDSRNSQHSINSPSRRANYTRLLPFSPHAPMPDIRADTKQAFQSLSVSFSGTSREARKPSAWSRNAVAATVGSWRPAMGALEALGRGWQECTATADICSKPWGPRAWNGNGGKMHVDFLENLLKP